MREIEASAKPLTDTQRGKYLDVLREKPTLGNREALRRAGYTAGASSLAVTRTQVKALFAADPDLEYDAQIARGKDPVVAEDVIFRIAQDATHAKQFDAAKFIAQHRLPDYQDRTKVDVEHTGTVTVEKREVSLQGVLHVLAEAGALDAGSLADLAAARNLLPAQPD